MRPVGSLRLRSLEWGNARFFFSEKCPSLRGFQLRFDGRVLKCDRSCSRYPEVRPPGCADVTGRALMCVVGSKMVQPR